MCALVIDDNQPVVVVWQKIINEFPTVEHFGAHIRCQSQNGCRTAWLGGSAPPFIVPKVRCRERAVVFQVNFVSLNPEPLCEWLGEREREGNLYARKILTFRTVRSPPTQKETL